MQGPRHATAKQLGGKGVRLGASELVGVTRTSRPQVMAQELVELCPWDSLGTLAAPEATVPRSLELQELLSHRRWIGARRVSLQETASDSLLQEGSTANGSVMLGTAGKPQTDSLAMPSRKPCHNKGHSRYTLVLVYLPLV